MLKWVLAIYLCCYLLQVLVWFGCCLDLALFAYGLSFGSAGFHLFCFVCGDYCSLWVVVMQFGAARFVVWVGF